MTEQNPEKPKRVFRKPRYTPKSTRKLIAVGDRITYTKRSPLQAAAGRIINEAGGGSPAHPGDALKVAEGYLRLEKRLAKIALVDLILKLDLNTLRKLVKPPYEARYLNANIIIQPTTDLLLRGTEAFAEADNELGEIPKVVLQRLVRETKTFE